MTFHTNSNISICNNIVQIKKDNFNWTGGENWLDPQGPVMVNGVTVWGFSNPYPSGNQCIGLQSSSFIQQSMYLTSGQHTISLYYHTRSMDNANPINILMNNIIIGTFGSVAVSSWTFYSQTFTIPTS